MQPDVFVPGLFISAYFSIRGWSIFFCSEVMQINAVRVAIFYGRSVSVRKQPLRRPSVKSSISAWQRGQFYGFFNWFCSVPRFLQAFPFGETARKFKNVWIWKLFSSKEQFILFVLFGFAQYSKFRIGFSIHAMTIGNFPVVFIFISVNHVNLMEMLLL